MAISIQTKGNTLQIGSVEPILSVEIRQNLCNIELIIVGKLTNPPNYWSANVLVIR